MRRERRGGRGEGRFRGREYGRPLRRGRCGGGFRGSGGSIRGHGIDGLGGGLPVSRSVRGGSEGLGG
jgi:hypothetical protein